MAAVALVLRTSWAGEQICGVGAQVLGRLIEQEVELAACEIEPLASRLTIGGVRIGPVSRPLFASDRLLVELSPLAFGKRLGIERFEIDSPRLYLVLPPGDGD